MLPAMPSAFVVASASSPRNRDAASVAPNTPHTDDGWKPVFMYCEETAEPIRATASLPATTAVRTSRPERPSVSATASAAGTTTAEV